MTTATIAPPFVPLCMEPAEWAEWQHLNEYAIRNMSYGLATAANREQARRPCLDCPTSYAIEMRAVGRCNGTPSGDEVVE